MRQLTHSAVISFQMTLSFCEEGRKTSALAISCLGLHEQRLTVCQRSRSACAFLSKYANNAAEYHARMVSRRAAAGQSPVMALPPFAPSPLQPAQAPSASPAIAPLSQAELFAST